MIDVKNLHPNWRELHANHISQLEQFVKSAQPSQINEAKLLLAEAIKDYEAIVVAVDEATWGKLPAAPRGAHDPSSGRPYASRSEQRERYEESGHNDDWC